MKTLLGIIAILSMLAGIVVLGGGTSVLQETVGVLLFVISVIALAGGAIVNAIDKLRNDLKIDGSAAKTQPVPPESFSRTDVPGGMP